MSKHLNVVGLAVLCLGLPCYLFILLHPSLGLVPAPGSPGRTYLSLFPPGSPTGGIVTILTTTPGGGYYGYFTFERTEIPRD